MFSDILHRGNLSADDRQQLFEGMTVSEIATAAEYAEQLRRCGMEIVRIVDLTDEWTRILVERLAMYRSLEAQTVARWGASTSSVTTARTRISSGCIRAECSQGR